MPVESPSSKVSPSTPCIGVCRLDAQGLCEGCRRNGDEIARWRMLDEAERRRIMCDVLPRRPSR